MIDSKYSKVLTENEVVTWVGLRLTSRHCLVFSSLPCLLLTAISLRHWVMSPQTRIEDTGSSSALTQLAGHLFASQCLSIPLAQCIRHKLRDAWARSGTSPQSSPDLIAKCQPQKQRLPCIPSLPPAWLQYSNN